MSIDFRAVEIELATHRKRVYHEKRCKQADIERKRKTGIWLRARELRYPATTDPPPGGDYDRDECARLDLYDRTHYNCNPQQEPES